MLVALALICPPLALRLCRKPFQAGLCLAVWGVSLPLIPYGFGLVGYLGCVLWALSEVAAERGRRERVEWLRDLAMIRSAGHDDRRPAAPADPPAASGSFAVPVVALPSYLANLERLFGPADAGELRRVVEARLVLEADNPRDRRAVRVEVEKKIVGYLARGDAALFRRELARLGQERLTTPCPALVHRAPPRGRTPGGFGIWLDLPGVERAREPTPAASAGPAGPNLFDRLRPRLEAATRAAAEAATLRWVPLLPEWAQPIVWGALAAVPVVATLLILRLFVRI